MSNIINKLIEKRVKQDNDIEDKEGSQPAKYHSGLDKSTKQKRDAHFKAKKTGPAPGDADGVTKKSVHTKKYEKMFGESQEIQKALKKVKGLTKQQMQVLSTMSPSLMTTVMQTMSNLVMGESVELQEKITGLVNKSEKSGISYGILKKVYDRGLAAYKTGHRPGTTAPQWAMARVNSFLTGGGARKADADLWKQAKGQKEEIEEQLEKIKGKTPADNGRRAAVKDDIKDAEKKGDKKLVAKLKEASARADAMRAMRKGKEVDPADLDSFASDDDIKAASKNIIMQMRKAVSLRGNFPVEFVDKKKVKVSAKIAAAVQNKYNSMRRANDKEKFQAKVAKSYKDMLSALKEESVKEQLVSNTVNV